MTDFEYKLKKACYKLFRIIGTIPKHSIVTDWRAFHPSFESPPTLFDFVLNSDGTLSVACFSIDGAKVIHHENVKTINELYRILSCECYESAAFEFIRYTNKLVGYKTAFESVEMRCIRCQTPPIVRKSAFNEVIVYRFVDYKIDPRVSPLPLLIFENVDTKEQNTYHASSWKYDIYNTLSI